MAADETGNLLLENASRRSEGNLIECESDNTFDGLLEIVTDVNKRLQNVDAVNRKMQQQKMGMSKELANQKSQISFLFQENCSLKEKVARLDMEKKGFVKEASELKRVNDKLNRVLDEKKCCGGGSSEGTSLGSSKSWSSVVSNTQIQQPTTSLPNLKQPTPPIPPDELILAQINASLNNLIDLKNDLNYVNHSLKYFIYYYYNTKQKEKFTRRHQPLLVARGGGEPDSLEEEQIQHQPNEKWPSFLAKKERTKNTSNDDEILESFFKRRHLPWPNDTICYERGLSTEAIATSSILSPDSLSSFAANSDSDIGASVVLKEERFCPICERLFPENVEEKTFLRHVDDHFAIEEFELVN